MGAFQSGFQMGQGAYQDAQDRDMRQREMVLRESQAAQDSQLRGLQITAATRLNTQAQRSQDASTDYSDKITSGLQTGNTSGMSDASTRMLYTGAGGGAPGQQAVDSAASYGNAENARFGLPTTQFQTSSTVAPDGQAAPLAAPTVRTRKMSQAEQADARANMYAQQEDWQGHERATKEAQGFRKLDDSRGFIGHIQDLKARGLAGDKNATAELQQIYAPVTKLYTDHPDDPNAYHFDPKTHSIVQVPYGAVDPKTGRTVAGTPRDVPESEQLPALLAHRDLTSEYGDPQAAAVALAGMGKTERDRRLAAAKTTFDQAVGVSTADAAQIHAAASRTSAGAAVTNAKTMQDYHGAQTRQMNDQQSRREAAADIVAKMDSLDPRDPNYVKTRQALTTQFNALNVKNGGTIPLGRDNTGSARSVLQTPSEQKVNPDGSYTAFAKDGGAPLYNTWHGEPMPLGMEVDDFKKLRQTAVAARVEMQLREDNGRLMYLYVGPDGVPYPTVEQAGRSKATKASQPTASAGPARPAEPQPVDVRALQRGLVMPALHRPTVMDPPMRPMGEGAGLVNLARGMPRGASPMDPDELRQFGAPQTFGR